MSFLTDHANLNHIEREHDKTDETEIENESNIANIRILVEACCYLACEIRVSVDRIVEITIAYSPCLDVVGPYIHLLQGFVGCVVEITFLYQRDKTFKAKTEILAEARICLIEKDDNGNKNE